MGLLTVQQDIICYSLMEVGHHEGAPSRCFLLGRQMRRRRGMRPAILGMAEAEEAVEVEGEAGGGVDGAGLRAVTQEATPSQQDPMRFIRSPPF